MAIKLTSGVTPGSVTEKTPEGHTVTTNVYNISEGFAEVYFNRGLAYLDIRKYNEAYEDFSKVIEYFPKDAEAYFKRSIVNYCLEDDIASKKDLEKANRIDPKNTEEYFWAQFQ